MLKKLTPKSEFTRNVLTLMTGTTIAQAIPIAISPILTRIYAPEDFGIYSLFLSILVIMGSIINGRYELAIMLPEKDEDAINLAMLSLIITFGISLGVFFLIYFFKDFIIEMLGQKNIEPWLYFIPLALLLTGLYNILNYFNNRQKNYKDLANAIIIKSFALAIVQVIVGTFKNGVSGLIFGKLISLLISNYKLLKNILNNKSLIGMISKSKILEVGKRYKKFPIYSMPSILANNLSQNLLNILISMFYSLTTLGFYSLIQRTLGVPSVLIGTSIGQVFFQKASEERKKNAVSIDTLRSTTKKLLLIAIPMFGILFFSVEDIFTFIFGEKWKIAGEYGQIMIPWFFFRFVVAPVSVITVIFETHIIALFWQLSLLFFSILIIYISNLYNYSFKFFLYILSGSSSIHYIILYIILYQIAKKGIKE